MPKSDPEKELVQRLIEYLVAKREEQGMSQNRLSELAGVSRTGIRHFESGTTNPTLYFFLKVAKALDVDLTAVLDKNV